jgi:hypothetical protein
MSNSITTIQQLQREREAILASIRAIWGTEADQVEQLGIPEFLSVKVEAIHQMYASAAERWKAAVEHLQQRLDALHQAL